jgi:hypothetical protein
MTVRIRTNDIMLKIQDGIKSANMKSVTFSECYEKDFNKIINANLALMGFENSYF